MLRTPSNQSIIGDKYIFSSPIIDCFDGMPITWTVGTSPNADLVNTMLDNAIVLLKGKRSIVDA